MTANWTSALAQDVAAGDSRILLTVALGGQRGSNYVVIDPDGDMEIMRVSGIGDRDLYVERGQLGTAAIAHAAGQAVARYVAPTATTAGPHTHDYAAPDHTHAAGDHPDLATHAALGLASTAHDHDGSYAATSHGHVEADVTSLTTDLDGKAATGHDHDAAYSASGHTHAGGDHPDLATHDGLGLATQAELDAHDHDADYSTTGHSHPGGSQAFPVGAVFLAIVATDPATLLGYGTWTAIAAGRMLLGVGGAFDTAEATGGAETHTHADHTGVISHTHGVTVTDPGHVHDEYTNSATTGGSSGWAARDTSTNTASLTDYDTGSATTGITAATTAPAGAVNALTHDSPSHLPPYFVVYAWKRTA
jgi:hypothetical protein